MGVLGWPPAAFWAATPHDFAAALDGYLESIGQRTPHAALTRAEMETLMQRFPDARR